MFLFLSEVVSYSDVGHRPVHGPHTIVGSKAGLHGASAAMIGFFWRKLVRFSPPTYMEKLRNHRVIWALSWKYAGKREGHDGCPSAVVYDPACVLRR